jgi:hypothetical protein
MKAKKPSRLDPALIVFLVFATLLGGYMRIFQVAQLRFPMNDGGMFYSMTADLMANGFHLPTVTSYNSADIAYAYPPLAFYLVGALARATDWPLIDLFRILPAVIASLTIPAFFLLANVLLKSKAQTALATLVFALMPATFAWLIMGGGISRSLGFLFSILTLWSAYRLYTRAAITDLVATAILGALAVLSHPEAAIHTAAAALLFFVFFGRSKRGLLLSLAVACGVIVLTAPWWAVVISTHGLGPILAATRTGGYNLDTISVFAQLNNSDEMFLTFMGCFAVLGVFILLAKRQWFLPAWLVVTILSEPRSAPLYITPDLALLIGITLDGFVLAGFNALEAGHPALPASNPSRWAEALFTGRMTKLVSIYLLVYFIMTAFSVPFSEAHTMTLKSGDLAAFAWIKANLPPDNRFAVITGDQPLTDPTAEWFPAMTGQVSVATVQGREWDQDNDFNLFLSRSSDLQECAFQDAVCIDRWMNATGLSFDYVYFSKDTLAALVGSASIPIPLQRSLVATGAYQVIYETGDAAVLKFQK